MNHSKSGKVCVLMAAMFLAASPALAEETCHEFGFIYQKSFVLGDGEGMETHACKEPNFVVGDKLYASMQSLIKSGKFDQADTELSKALTVNRHDDYQKYRPNSEVCVRTGLQKDFRALMDQIGRNTASKAEKSGKPEAAILVHTHYCQYDDAGRIYLDMAKTNPLRLDTHKDALDYATTHKLQSLHTELRKIATANPEKLMAQEDKMFKAGANAADILQQALEWIEFSNDGSKQKARILTQAEKRGDSLAAQDGCNPIEPALAYYQVAGKPAKVTQLKSRALKFGEQFEKQGSLPAAARCYALADAHDKARKLENKADVQRALQEDAAKKAEPARQKKFSKETDDLEKELGL